MNEEEAIAWALIPFHGTESGGSVAFLVGHEVRFWSIVLLILLDGIRSYISATCAFLVIDGLLQHKGENVM
ncbi:hypothetical protein FQA39_LY11959 [Lamprigera yunnana]|nr:hypothetical protein FQA39_LY11959 [Lamprigera yunnana]